MVPALLTTHSPLLRRHHLIGCSTGYMVEQRGHWPELVDEAASVSSMAVELSAISEPELPGLLAFLQAAPRLPFRYVSVHAPSKHLDLPEPDLVEQLASLPTWIDAIVIHPDTIENVEHFRKLGRRLVLENMDSRKASGRTTEELEALFGELPEARLCFDIAHAKSMDETMSVGREILQRFGPKLRHVHLSSLDDAGHHVSLTPEDEELFLPLLGSCRDVPWILEAPPAS